MGDKLDNQNVQIIFRTKIFYPTVNGLSDDREAVPWESLPCDVMESEARGEYYKKGDTHYCLYEEQPEGWDRPGKVMLKWKEAILERRVRGEMVTHMVFEPGKCRYYSNNTPYGDLSMETETRRLEITEEQDSFFLLLEYGIKQGGQIVSEFRMEIHIQGMGESI
ncbi:MAG: DUF1934 domain-containing protein [Acetatifactor sp.]|nr:DUF1934 domain-containing protein [Acetatifactor sp.]